MDTNKITPIHIHQTSSDYENLAEQLADLIQQYRDHMDDQNPEQEAAIMKKMEELLEKNKTLILEQCARNGYREDSSNWTEHYATFLNQSIEVLQKTLAYHQEHPSAPLPHASLDLLNEMTTQLHFLMVPPKISFA